jgi:hypothetical protein
MPSCRPQLQKVATHHVIARRLEAHQSPQCSGTTSLSPLLQVRGKDPPRPIRAWTQSGLSSKVLEVLRRGGFDKPLAIQAQVCSSYSTRSTLPLCLSIHGLAA